MIFRHSLMPPTTQLQHQLEDLFSISKEKGRVSGWVNVH
jgi:hypothetical protein